jgi:hypothetical protein
MKNNGIIIYNKYNNILMKIIKNHQNMIKIKKYKNWVFEYQCNNKITKKI